MKKKHMGLSRVEELFDTESALMDAACYYSEDPSDENRATLRKLAAEFADAARQVEGL